MNEKNAMPAGGPPAAPRAPLTDAEKLWRIRHSTSHVMAAAVLQIFPDAKFAIGPPIENGFYYDFDLPRALTPDDLDAISVKMKALVKQNDTFVRTEMGIDEAIAYCREQGQEYKVELIEGLAERGETSVSFYQVGEFNDLCAGPHVGRSGNCKAFHLLKVAGAYWRGDSDRPMLQRIYGTAWKNKTDLAAYLELLEEAKKRDHRKLANELDLFSFNKLSPGAVFWHPKGWTVYQNLLAYSREVHEAGEYQEIHNPLIFNKSLFETSGHWAHYNEHMFKLESEGETYCVKPMNCPDNMVFYMRKKHSYRELPLRVLEYQTLHRNELSGALNGIFRVRQFTQDDGHIFVRPDQIEEEINAVLHMIREIYGTFNLEYRVNLSTRPDDFMGEPELWDEAEAALKRSIESNDLEYRVKEGDGAFYGPKIDFDVLDSLGRKWQCATVQLDFQLPLRFDLTYTDTDNLPKVPIVIHRAIFGSIERFLGILLEHVGGAFPTWLAPVQVQLLSINDECAVACHDAAKKLRAKGVRVHVDDRAEKLGRKIREAELAKTPYMLVVGMKELESGEFSVRSYQDGDRGTLSYEALESEVLQKISERTFDVTLKQIEWSTDEEEDVSDALEAEY